MNPWNNVKGFQKFSLCDWAGKSSAVIFLGGCNFRCPTCHNWQMATAPNSIETISRDVIMDYLTSKSSWLDGVVITGGEPTITPGLGTLLKEIKTLDLPVNLHTNGFRPAVVRNFIGRDLVDTFSVDIKGPWSLYSQLTGGNTFNHEAKVNLGSIFDLAQLHLGKFYFRTTHVPLLTEEDITTCRSYLPDGHELHIQKYREPEQLKDGGNIINTPLPTHENAVVEAVT